MRTVGIVACAGLAASAAAQVITTPGITASLDLTWQEDPVFPHNDNGVLEPGEAALMLMSVSFTGQFTVVNFQPAIGTFSSGTILGLGWAAVDIRSFSPDATGLYNCGITQPTSSSVGPNANNEGTSGYGIRAGWRNGGNVANGSPAANGFQNLGPGQLPASPALANTTAPIDAMVRLGWQPNSYSDRTVTFGVQAGAGGTPHVGLYIQLDEHTGAFVSPGDSRVTWGSVSIPVAPAPTGIAVIGAGAMTLRRRRRRREEGATR